MSQAVIYKYPFEIADRFVIPLPEEYKILRVACQNDKPCMWVMGGVDSPLKKRVFRIFGTGHPVPLNDVQYFDHIASFETMVNKMSFVWHLFNGGDE